MSEISAGNRTGAGADDGGGEAEYDVAVIGYGPTGVTAANLLGAAGLRVVVLERDAEIYARAQQIRGGCATSACGCARTPTGWN